MTEIPRDLVASLMERERTRFSNEHPRSRELDEQAGGPLLSGVPMNWMTRWPGDFPIWVSEAEGARLIDVDGNRVRRPLPRRHRAR